MNKKLGNDFEARFCKLLSENGFWVHNFAQNQAGQPADVIAVRDGKAYLIDCKVCSDDVFRLSRMEENQSLAMNHWLDCGNGKGWFALLFAKQGLIYMLPNVIKKLVRAGLTQLRIDDIRNMGESFDQWNERNE